MTRRTVVLIVVGVVACVAAAALVLWLIVVPAFMNSGVGQSFQAAFRLQQAIMASGLVDDADVRFGINRDTRGTTRTLTVDVRWRGEPASPQDAATQIAKISLEQYEEIEEVDVLSIGLNRVTNAGPITTKQAQRFNGSPAEWRERVARLPG